MHLSSKLSVPGRAALHDHMVRALAPESRAGLDREAVIQDANILDDDLRLMVSRIAEIQLLSVQGLEQATRRELVDELAQLLDRASMKPEALQSSSEVEIRSNAPGVEDGRSDALSYQSPRQQAIAQGRSGNVSQRVLREARRLAGWLPLNRMPGNDVQRQATFQRLTKKYIERRMAEGVSRDTAEAQMQKEYIAVTQRYKAKRTCWHLDEQPAEIVQDTDHPTVRWVDLSPDAQQDFLREVSYVKQAKGPNAGMAEIYRRSGLPYDPEHAQKLVRKLMEDRLSNGHDAGFDGYITVLSRQYRGKPVEYYVLSPAATLDIENVLTREYLTNQRIVRGRN